MNIRNLQLYVLANRKFSNKRSEPTTICFCKTDNKCAAKAHGQNEYSEPTTGCSRNANILKTTYSVDCCFGN